MSCDVAIIGGGPAGATVAAILLRHHPDVRVKVFERTPFPRWHPGETLVSEINRVLKEMGVYDKMDRAGFIRKYGATFRWGSGDEPWDMIFGDLAPAAAASGGDDPVQTTYTWHVERSRYDAILLDHAEELGAQVMRETGVAALLRDGSGRVVGVRDEAGVEHVARFVVDATGQAGIEGSLSEREQDPRLQNIAFGTYWEGFDLVDTWNGSLDESRAFIVAHPYGWTWTFPVRDDLLSVGVVTSVEAHRARGDRSPEQVVKEAVASSPALRDILGDATMVEGPSGRRVQVMRDFSYTAKHIVQPGLVRVGDAAGFVDPILSVGCFLGQTLGRYLAYALGTALDAEVDIDEDLALTAYADQVRDTLATFRELTYFFYNFNRSREDWWARARDLVADTTYARASDDEEAFLAFATGFAANGSVWREPGAVFDAGFFADIHTRFVAPGARLRAEQDPLRDDEVLTLTATPTFSDGAVPVEGTGRLSRALRVSFASPDDDGRLRRMHVPPAMRAVFDEIDGLATVRQIGDRVAERLGVTGRHRRSVHRYVRWVLEGLRDRGVASADGGSGMPSGSEARQSA